jgi:uncharacterized membrane protein
MMPEAAHWSSLDQLKLSPSHQVAAHCPGPNSAATSANASNSRPAAGVTAHSNPIHFQQLRRQAERLSHTNVHSHHPCAKYFRDVRRTLSILTVVGTSIANNSGSFSLPLFRGERWRHNMSVTEQAHAPVHWKTYEGFGDLARDRARRPAKQQSAGSINVGNAERKVSLASGTILALAGLSRRDLPGLIVAGIGGSLLYRGATGHCSAYKALGVSTADSQSSHRQLTQSSSTVDITQSFLIDRPADELYKFWRNFENLPDVMSHLQSVEDKGDGLSHWRADAPNLYGGYVEWDAKITADEPNKRIAWQSLPDSSLQNEGSIEFERAPGDRGTLVRVTMHYSPPAGQAGHFIAKLFGSAPDQQIREDLRRFKQLMEVGEAPTIEGQSHGSCTGLGILRQS